MMQIEINPFASKYTSPQTCLYVEGQHSRQLLGALVHGLNMMQCVQVVGPHGAGKTTFAVNAAKRLSSRFRQARMITLRRSTASRRVSWSIASELLFSDQTDSDLELVILDGLEQLTFLHRMCLVQAFRDKQTNLIVTCHKPVSFIRHRLDFRPSVSTFRSIANTLLENADFDLSDEETDAVFQLCGGNYRTGLSMLYDRYTAKAQSYSRHVWTDGNRICLPGMGNI